MQFQHLNWDDLRVFLEVARAGNISKSAKRLNVDHSTASRRIAQLEYSLGSSLFERNRNGLILNALGERLLVYVEGIESNVLAIGEAVGSKELELSGTVRVGTMEGIASLYLAKRFAGLRERYGSLRIELVTSSQQLYVTRREADIFLSFFRPEGRGLNVEIIGKFHLHLYGARTYLDKRGVPTSIKELAAHDFVAYVHDLIQVDTVRWLDEVIANPNIVFHSTSMIAQMHAASSGLGLVLLPTFAEATRHGLERIPLDNVLVERPIWLSAHQDLQYVPRVKAVLQYLKATVRNDMAFLTS